MVQCECVCCNCSKEKSNPHQNISKEILTFYNFIININIYKNKYFKVRKTAINDLYKKYITVIYIYIYYLKNLGGGRGARGSCLLLSL